jgi:hypothetical protein
METLLIVNGRCGLWSHLRGTADGTQVLMKASGFPVDHPLERGPVEIPHHLLALRFPHDVWRLQMYEYRAHLDGRLARTIKGRIHPHDGCRVR